MQNCVGSSKLCKKSAKKRLVVRICGGNGLKCEYVRETTKSAIPDPLHLIVASGECPSFLEIRQIMALLLINGPKLFLFYLTTSALHQYTEILLKRFALLNDYRKTAPSTVISSMHDSLSILIYAMKICDLRLQELNSIKYLFILFRTKPHACNRFPVHNSQETIPILPNFS